MFEGMGVHISGIEKVAGFTICDSCLTIRVDGCTIRLRSLGLKTDDLTPWKKRKLCGERTFPEFSPFPEYNAPPEYNCSQSSIPPLASEEIQCGIESLEFDRGGDDSEVEEKRPVHRQVQSDSFVTPHVFVAAVALCTQSHRISRKALQVALLVAKALHTHYDFVAFLTAGMLVRHRSSRASGRAGSHALHA